MRINGVKTKKASKKVRSKGATKVSFDYHMDILESSLGQQNSIFSHDCLFIASKVRIHSELFAKSYVYK